MDKSGLLNFIEVLPAEVLLWLGLLALLPSCQLLLPGQVVVEQALHLPVTPVTAISRVMVVSTFLISMPLESLVVEVLVEGFLEVGVATWGETTDVATVRTYAGSAATTKPRRQEAGFSDVGHELSAQVPEVPHQVIVVTTEGGHQELAVAGVEDVKGWSSISHHHTEDHSQG